MTVLTFLTVSPQTVNPVNPVMSFFCHFCHLCHVKFFLLLPRIGFGGYSNRYIFLYILSHPLPIADPLSSLCPAPTLPYFTCRAPFTIRGLRFWLFFHSDRYISIFLSSSCIVKITFSDYKIALKSHFRHINNAL